MKLTPFAIAMLASYSRAFFMVRPENVDEYQDLHLDQTCEQELMWVGKKSMTLAQVQSEMQSGLVGSQTVFHDLTTEQQRMDAMCDKFGGEF